MASDDPGVVSSAYESYAETALVTTTNGGSYATDADYTDGDDNSMDDDGSVNTPAQASTRIVSRSMSLPVSATVTRSAGRRTPSQRTVSEGHAHNQTSTPDGRGTKKKVCLSQEERNERRKMTNRKAAQKSRTKEKEKESTLMKETLNEESRSTSLKYEIRRLKKQKAALEQLLSDHLRNTNENRCILKAITNSSYICNRNVPITSPGHGLRHESPTSTPSPTPSEVPFASYNASSHFLTTSAAVKNEMTYDNGENLQASHNDVTLLSTVAPGAISGAVGGSVEASVAALAAHSEKPHIYIPMDQFRVLAAQRVNEWGNGVQSGMPLFGNATPHVSPSVVNSMASAAAVTTTSASIHAQNINHSSMPFDTAQNQGEIILPVPNLPSADNCTIVASELTPTDMNDEDLNIFIGDTQTGTQAEEKELNPENDARTGVNNITEIPKLQLGGQGETANSDSIAVSALLELNRGIVENPTQ